jgi:predicted phage terminase large subunit-like protein
MVSPLGPRVLHGAKENREKASGTPLIQELIRKGVAYVTRYAPGDGKTMRLHSVTSTIENGFVYLPTEAEWLSSYLHELEE